VGSLRPQTAQKVASADAIRKTRAIVAPCDQFGAAVLGIDDSNIAPKPAQVDGSR
jgi:hypothetical protein